MAEPIRVVLIEDNEVYREALELLLELDGEFEVVGSEPDGTRAVECCNALRPAVVLVDYRLPELDGVQVTAALREGCPEAAVVALTAAAEESEVEAMLAAGAVECVRKDEPLDTILSAVRRAAGRGAAGGRRCA